MPNKTSMEEIQKLAAKRGGKCLSISYEYGTPLEWECKNGHRWPSHLSNIKDNCWCRVCANRPILTINDCKKEAEKFGGKCLSTFYKNKKQPLWWECEKKHVWPNSLDAVRHKKNWCTWCNGTAELSKYHLIETAAKFDGYFLSDEYNGVGEFYKWRCKLGHEWDAIGQNVRYGFWCETCYHLSQRNTIEDAVVLANKNNGKFLSKEYNLCTDEYEWQCEKGHVWPATYSTINSGHWCTTCSESWIERICREIFEDIFKYKFPRIRPKWLMGPKNRPLELDGYCGELNIAFEYNGPQHYQIVDKYKMDEDDLKYQIEKDILKNKICNDLNIKLITIKPISSISKKKIKQIILEELKKEKLK